MFSEDIKRIFSEASEMIKALPGTHIHQSRGLLHITNPGLRIWVTVEQTGPNAVGGLFTLTEYRVSGPIKVVATCAWEVITWIQRRIFEGEKK